MIDLIERLDLARSSLRQAASGSVGCLGSSASQIHASRANHSCSALQCGQSARAKNTGVALKLRRSATIPVGMSRPVLGHLIITAPMELSRVTGSMALFLVAGFDDGLTRARRQRDISRDYCASFYVDFALQINRTLSGTDPRQERFQPT
jgi:hypothetical protein